MVSGKLVHLIETHGEEIITRVITKLRQEPEMGHTRALLDRELRERGRDLLKNLGHWLRAGSEEDLIHRYETLGKANFEDKIPLHESVRGLCLIREKMMDFVEENIDAKTTVDLYAEEELDRRLVKFFDLLIIHMVVGYERALRRSVAAIA